MATGALAYDILEQRDPEGAIAAILRLMQAHPDRGRFDSQLGGLAGREGERRLFELMAIWPDAVRGTPYALIRVGAYQPAHRVLGYAA